MRSAYALCLLFFVPFVSPCQLSAPSTSTANSAKESATVAGTVLGLDTGEPLKKARVTLASRTDFEKSVMDTTDELGHFRFENVEPNSYLLLVSRNGYVNAEYGQKKIAGSGTVLTLLRGQQMTDLNFKLSRAAAIAGHVFDEDGEPVPRAEVVVFRASGQAGKERMVDDRPASTNDLGEYRVFDLAPGRYYVAASYQPGGSQHGFPRLPKCKNKDGYLPSYFPNTTDPSKAQPIIIRAGDELRSVDFLMHPAHLVSISGKVFVAGPASSTGYGNISIYPRGAGLLRAMDSESVSFDVKDGSFEIQNVPPGSYYMVATFSDRDSGGGSRLTRRELEVSSFDIEGVTLTISRGSDIQGRLRWEGTAPRDLQGVYVFLEPVDMERGLGPPSQRVKSDGTFLLKNIPDGLYRPSVHLRGGDARGFLKSAQFGDLPVTEAGFLLNSGSDASLELVMSSRSALVSGVVLNSDSLPAAGVHVILVPDEPHRKDLEKFRMETTDQNGKFAMASVEPGNFKLFSWDSADDSDWFDQEWLKAYEPKGISVRVEEADSKFVQLNLIDVPKDSSADP